MKTHSIEQNSSSIISKSKKIFFLIAIFATVFLQKSFAQNSVSQSQLLTSYYDIKNALVAGNAGVASTKAGDFIKALNSLDDKIVSEEKRKDLLKGAEQISERKDIRHQREHFSTFSTNMYALVKSTTLTSEPVYYDYCPMKKSYWLSSDKSVKNPYYGSAMLTCGKVTETIE